MKEAAYYNRVEDNNIQCVLCPHKCYIHEGERGKCLVRLNDQGRLYAENYNLISALNFDPIEKKPLYHFYPGSKILSIGTVGCNFSCGFCQNCDISQKTVDEYPGLMEYHTRSLIEMARAEAGNIGLAYTYNEPAIYYEFMMDLAAMTREAGLKNVMVTNGFIETKPLSDLLQFIDAFNVDLKSFDPGFYKQRTGGRLQPVLKTLERIRSSGKHLELTNLVIPGLNDNVSTFRDMIGWIHDNLGINTVLHLSRYHPAYKYQIPATPEPTMHKLYEIAGEKLPFVYLGNIRINSGNNTHCPDCGGVLIKRAGYIVSVSGIQKNNVCKTCGADLKQFLTI